MKLGLTTQQQYQPMALAGFFSWLKRAVNKVVNAVKIFLPRSVYEILNDFTNGDGRFSFGGVFGSQDPTIQGRSVVLNTNGVTTDLPLTPSEEAILNQWLSLFTAYVKPFFKLIKEQRDNAPTLLELKNTYNKVQRLISVLSFYINYTSINGENGFTLNTVRSRNEFLKIQIETLQETLGDLVSQFNIDLKPISKNVAFQAMNYEGLAFDLPTTFNATTLEFYVKNVEGVDVGGDDDENSENTVLTPVSGGETNKINYSKWALILLAAYGAKKILINSNK